MWFEQTLMGGGGNQVILLLSRVTENHLPVRIFGKVQEQAVGGKDGVLSPVNHNITR